MMPETWISPPQVCDMWPGMTVTLLQRMRDEGRGPAYSKTGKNITYAESDVHEYLRSRRVSTREQV